MWIRTLVWSFLVRLIRWSSPTVIFSTVRSDMYGIKPSRKHAGDAGYDLFASATTIIPPNSGVDVPHNIRVCIPNGLYLRLTGRSSTMRKHGLLVLEGIIDNGYRGELFSYVHNTTDQPVVVEQGQRVSQLIPAILHPMQWAAYPYHMWPATTRGTGGFGSTGS